MLDDTPPKAPNAYDLDRRVALLEQSNATIKDELHKINANIERLVWIVLGAVIMAVLATVIKGM